jgi:hypothetical protein
MNRREWEFAARGMLVGGVCGVADSVFHGAGPTLFLLCVAAWAYIGKRSGLIGKRSGLAVIFLALSAVALPAIAQTVGIERSEPKSIVEPIFYGISSSTSATPMIFSGTGFICESDYKEGCAFNPVVSGGYTTINTADTGIINNTIIDHVRCFSPGNLPAIEAEPYYTACVRAI